MTQKTQTMKRMVAKDKLPVDASIDEKKTIENSLKETDEQKLQELIEKEEQAKETNENTLEAIEKEAKKPKDEQKQVKGANLFKCRKIKYIKGDDGEVMMPKKNGKISELNPQEYHKILGEQVDKITSAIDKQDIEILNSQSLNSGYYYQIIEK